MSETFTHGGKIESYEDFVNKFKGKKTSDDCFTPPEVYKIISDYFCNMLNIDPDKIIRPFWPGGDYKSEDYSEKIVLDNPPFSKMKEITDFYNKNNIKFILFIDGKTWSKYSIKYGIDCCNASIIYENGARVKTCFVSNLWDGIILDGKLDKLLKDYYYTKVSKKLPTTPRKESQYTSLDLSKYIPKDGSKKIIEAGSYYYDNDSAIKGKKLYGGAIILKGGKKL